MKGKIFVTLFICITAVLSIIRCIPNGRKYINAYVFNKLDVDSTNIPAKNKLILRYTAQHGSEISPTYETAVCTEYVIKILSNFGSVSSKTKTDIRIITDKEISDLLKQNSPIPKGVYTALINAKSGVAINKQEDVKAGDFVQFWNYYDKKYVGHCGIVRALDIKKGIISMYSSSPRTNGHGIQTYIIPDYIYFVRLK
jgi:hypothetical protein